MSLILAERVFLDETSRKAGRPCYRHSETEVMLSL